MKKGWIMQQLQQKLSKEQIKAFYHDYFVDEQVGNFIALMKPYIDPPPARIIDVGGGAGFFAESLQERVGVETVVLDSDPKSVSICKQRGVEAVLGDALNPEFNESDVVVCLNLILHHLVGRSEQDTAEMQSRALMVWKSSARVIFVSEYVYESFLINSFSGKLIYLITKNSFLSFVGRLISRIVPSLRANTFGVGVRFRSKAEWLKMFGDRGFEVVGMVRGPEDQVSLARRLLLIKSCRRDSFILRSAAL